MAFTNNLKKQVDIPVWEWCRLAPTASAAISSTCTADNSLYHVSFGRYIYFMNSNTAAVASATGYITGFFRYDTITDVYQVLNFPSLPLVTYSAMQFAGGQGYNARVISATSNTVTAAALTGKTLKGFDIRITGGTGAGQQRIVTDVADPVIAYAGTVTALTATPQNNVIDINANWNINQWAGYQVRFVHVSGQTQTRKIIYNSSTTLYFSDVAKFAEDQWAWTPIFTLTGSPLVVDAVGTPYQIESSTLTVDTPWLTIPDETSRFVVRSGGIWMVTSVAASSTYATQYYDIAADQWYVRNACLLLGPVGALASEATIVNSGENATVFERGIALGTHSTKNLQDTTKNWTINQWVGYSVRIFSGTGEGKNINIISNTSNSLNFDPVISLDAITVTTDTGVNGTYIVTTTTTLPVDCNGQSITGTGIGLGAKIVSGQGTKTMILSVANSSSVTGLLVIGTSATGNSGEYTILTSLPVPQVCNGWTISGTGIATGATIVSGQGTTNLVLSLANSGPVSGIITLDFTIVATSGSMGAYTIITSSVAPSNCNGWTISGTGIATGATIISGQGTTNLVLSLPNIANISGNTLIFDLIPDATSHYFIDAFEAGIITSVNPPSSIAAITATATTGIISTPNITTTYNTPANCNNWSIFGTGIALGTTILSGQGTKNLVLSANNTSAVSGILIISPSVVTATAASTCTINTYTITTSALTPYNCNGWYISGAGIGLGATILSGQGTTTLTLSMINTATFSSGTLYLCPTIIVPNISSLGFTGSSSSTTISTTPTTILTPSNCNGWYASGTGIAIGAIVVSGQGTNALVLSIANTGAVSGNIILSPTVSTATVASGTIGNYTITTNATDPVTPANCNGWFISGTGVGLGATIVSGQGTRTLMVSISNTATISAGVVLTLSSTALSNGSINGSVFIAGATTGAYYPGQILMGTGVQSPITINSPSGVCNTTSTQNIIVFSFGNPQALGITPGMVVIFLSGTSGSFTAGTYVTAVSSSTVTLSLNVATNLNNATVQFGPLFYVGGANSNGPLVTLTSTNTLVVGMYVAYVSGTAGAITAGTYITQINSPTTCTLSQAPTTALNTAILSFQPYQTTIVSQISGIPGGAGTYNIFPSQGTYNLGAVMTATGTATQFTITTNIASPSNCNGLAITGFGLAYGATIVSGQGTTTLTLSLANTATVSGSINISASTVLSSIIGFGNSILIDNTKNWPLNRWNNQVLRIKSGTASGDYRAILATVPGYTTYTSNTGVVSSVGNLITLATGSTTGLSIGLVVTVTTAQSTGVFVYGTIITAINSGTQFTVSVIPSTSLINATIVAAPVNTLVTYSSWNTFPDNTSRYVIHGDPDKIYMSFGGQTPTFIHNIEADTVTQGRMLDYGVARGLSAQYSDHAPIALLPASPTLPVLPIVSAVGYVAPVATIVAGSSSTNYITTLAHAGGIFPIGSWVTVAGTTVSAGESYNGTWQVIDSSPGVVKYFNNAGTALAVGTILQTNSIVLGGTLASGAFSTFGAGTTMMIYGCVPVAYNNAGVAVTVGTSQAAYTSGATSCSSVTTTVTTTTTVGLKAGMYLTKTAGTGTLLAGTYVVSITNATTFVINQSPSVALSAATLTTQALPSANGGYQGTSVASSSTTTITLTGSDTTANLRVGMIPVATGGTGTILAGTCITAITSATQFTVSVAPSPALSGVLISVVPTVSWTGLVPGNLITAGFVQKVPVAPLSGSNVGTTVTLLQTVATAGTYPIGSWITVSGATPGTYNGVYQVTASGGEGSISYIVPVAPSTTLTTLGTIGLATVTQLVNTVNSHSFKSGQYINHRGDTSFSAANNNITAPISTVLMFANTTPFLAIPSTQYIYSVAAPSGPMVNYGQATTQLCDMSKNWLPNQWAGCLVTYNITQFAATPTQPQIVASYIIANTNNTLIFAGTMTAQAPVAGVTRYVITSQANSSVQNSLGCIDSGISLGLQATTQLQDTTKAWVSPGGTVGILGTSITTATAAVTVPILSLANLYVGMQGIVMSSTTGTTLTAGATISSFVLSTGVITMSANFTTTGTANMLFGYGVTSVTAGGNTATILNTVSGLYVGMLAAVSLGSVTLPAGTTITAIAGLVVTLSNNFGGITGSATLSFTAPCSSSGNVVTVSGFTTAGLAVGMYVGVISGANYSVPLPTTGSFTPNGGVNLTSIKVTSILNATQFTVSAIPIIPLVNATVVASYWIPNQLVSRRVRISSGVTANFLEVIVTANNHNTLTFFLVTNATPVHGITGYSILQQPNRALGTHLDWNFGGSNLNTRGVYLVQARGGVATTGLPGWDRLDLQTDRWDFLMPTPSFEGLTVGAMYAYDGGDRIYFTTSGTNRVYYFDLDNMTIHGASQYPYLAGGVVPGNRMEIFETVDGLKYLWLNRNTAMECFKQLLFY